MILRMIYTFFHFTAAMICWNAVRSTPAVAPWKQARIKGWAHTSLNNILYLNSPWKSILLLMDFLEILNKIIQIYQNIVISPYN